MNAYFLCNAADAPHSSVPVSDWKHRVPDAANLIVRSHNPIFLNDQLTLERSFQSRGGTIAIIGMHGFQPIVSRRIGLLSPDRIVGGAEILNGSSVGIENPKNIRGMFCKPPKALLAFSHRLFGPFLGVYVLQDYHRALDFAGGISKRCGAHAGPGFVSIVGGVEKVSPRKDRFSTQGPRSRIVDRPKQSSVGMVTSPVRILPGILRWHESCPQRA